jgi:hypothetical protein
VAEVSRKRGGGLMGGPKKRVAALSIRSRGARDGYVPARRRRGRGEPASEEDALGERARGARVEGNAT